MKTKALKKTESVTDKIDNLHATSRPLTYKEHDIKLQVTEPIEASGDEPKQLFMPVFYEELLSGTVGEKKDEEFALSVAINGAALYFRRGKKWYVIKTRPLIESLLELKN